jgi:hypothetical protein
MKIVLVVLSALVILSGDIFSQAPASTPVPAPTFPVFTPYGLTQYRFRVRSIRETTTAGTDSAQLAYLHMIGYYAGLKVKINDQVSFQVQIGNDWVNTEQVTYLTSNHVGKKNALFPFFHLAYAKWDPGIINISVGIVPENGYGALDLLERSLALGNYGSSQGFGAGQVGWLTGTNGSITGFKLGIPVLKSKVKLSAEIVTGIVDDSTNARKQSWFTEAKNNPGQQLYLLDLPFSVGGLTITPQVATVLFRKYNYTTQKGDNEFNIGFGGTYKFNTIASLRVNAGYATFDNSSSHKSNTTVDSIEFKRVGTLAGAGATVKVGPGNILLDVNYSSDEDTKTAKSSHNKFYYGDIKYAWSANKNFEITPRVRVFRQELPDGNALKSRTEIRPEVIFTGKF